MSLTTVIDTHPPPTRRKSNLFSKFLMCDRERYPHVRCVF